MILFSSPREAEFGNPQATEVGGNSAQTLLVKRWCETWDFCEVCQQFNLEKLDQKSPRKYLDIWTEIVATMIQTQEDLFCVVKHTVGEVCSGVQPREPGSRLSASFLSNEPSPSLPQAHFIRSISTFF